MSPILSLVLSSISAKLQSLNLASVVKQRRTLFASALLLVIAPSTFAEEVHVTWNCKAGPDNQWLCAEEQIITSNRNRPARANLASSPFPDEPRVAAVRNLDWMEEEQMTEEQQLKIEGKCCGAYIEPPRTYPDANLTPEEASLQVNANSTEALENNVAVLEGDVQISQGYRQIRSNSARIDQTNRNVELQGNVQFREPGMLLLGSNANIDIDSKEVKIDNATYVLHEAAVRGSAKTLTRTKDGVITISDATYSTCEPAIQPGSWQPAKSPSTKSLDSPRLKMPSCALKMSQCSTSLGLPFRSPINALPDCCFRPSVPAATTALITPSQSTGIWRRITMPPLPRDWCKSAV